MENISEREHWISDSVTDTHYLIWYLQDSPRLKGEANEIFEACDRGESIIYIPTICLVEVVYLQEKGILPLNLILLQQELRKNTNFVMADLTEGVVEALAQIPREQIPDMPDRIIAATARHLNLPLMTRDWKIRKSAIRTI